MKLVWTAREAAEIILGVQLAIVVGFVLGGLLALVAGFAALAVVAIIAIALVVLLAARTERELRSLGL